MRPLIETSGVVLVTSIGVASGCPSGRTWKMNRPTAAADVADSPATVGPVGDASKMMAALRQGWRGTRLKPHINRPRLGSDSPRTPPPHPPHLELGVVRLRVLGAMAA